MLHIGSDGIREPPGRFAIDEHVELTESAEAAVETGKHQAKRLLVGGIRVANNEL
jgi:hypothetical protein